MPNTKSNKPETAKNTNTTSATKATSSSATKSSPVKSAVKPSAVNMRPTKAPSAIKPVKSNTVAGETKSVSSANVLSNKSAKTAPVKKAVLGKEISTEEINNAYSTVTPAVDSQGKPIVKEVGKDNINKNIAKEENPTEEKKKKKRLILIIFFILLGLALIATAIVVVLNIKSADIKFNIVVDADVQTTITGPGDETETLIYFPGDLIKGEMVIKVQNEKGIISSDENVFLRFKIEAIVDDNYYGGLFKPQFKRGDMWYDESPDGYFYYMQRCKGNETMNVFDYIEFVADGNNNVLNGKMATLLFTVEIIEGNYSAISQNWYTAPDEWRTEIR